jgi:hypothetical protein
LTRSLPVTLSVRLEVGSVFSGAVTLSF